ncbi:hypothetical protein Scep_015494 [Stephania cephalantha]|uniref:Uncharacterized protein n=1 Tax=Stephania cephalantha TaxID=152367 RepID=A0AAP0J585_9MAGN
MECLPFPQILLRQPLAPSLFRSRSLQVPSNTFNSSIQTHKSRSRRYINTGQAQ